jgi:hypothetical protein
MATQTTTTAEPVAVTADNFTRAETDMYFGKFVKEGGLGVFNHYRDLPLEKTGVRPTRHALFAGSF